MPNKLSRFWQELKRRKVVHVITVYAGAAFVILSLVDMIREPFDLPDWSFKLVVVILSVGLIIAVILSWIYDIHPEGGMVKTEPADKIKPEEVPRSSKGWKIASYISFVVIVGLVVLNVIPRTNNNRKFLEKSIAVLPLEYLSNNPDNEYLADGVLDAITLNLSKIEGLRVMPRTSVEQYRENQKSAKEIGEELDVSYLIEGSFQMVNDQVKLIIQLVVAAEGDHIFFKEYDRDYSDIFAVQSEVAQTIAREIEVVITPEEKELIERIPTTSLTAHNYYLKGREILRKHEPGGEDKSFLNEAERLFNLALERDPTYSMAYVGAGEVYYWYAIRYLNLWETDSAQLISDTVIELSNLALKYDPQNSEAFNLLGKCYYELYNNRSKALEEYEKALEYNPNDHIAQHYVGLLSNDFLKALISLHESLLRDNTEFINESLWGLVEIYSIAGFPEKAEYYATELLSINHDSARYYNGLSWIAYCSLNFDECLSYAEKARQIDSTSSSYFDYLHRIGNYKRIYVDFLKPYETDYYSDDLPDLGLYLNETFAAHLGIYYWYQGDTAKAKSLLEYYIKFMHQDFTFQNAYEHQLRDALWHWTEICSVIGDIDYASHLFKQFLDLSSNYDVFSGRQRGYYISFKMSPSFDNIRQESWFQDAIHEWESALASEHERIRQWLEENDML